MNKSNKQIIYEGVFRNKAINNDIAISELAYNVLIDYGSLNSAEAAEYVSKFSKSIANNIKKQNDELKIRGITPIGQIIPGNRISWNTTNEIQKNIWVARPILLDFIENLTDERFEALCCLVVEIIGGKAWRTRNKGDGNVDLYGTICSRLNNHIFGINTHLKVVGQCKNYSHKESITNFESFYRALDNVKFLSPRVFKEIPNDFNRDKGPIIGWYVCKDGFQSGIHTDAHNHGIILSDKYDLIEILVHLKLIGISSLESRIRLNLSKKIRKYL